MKKTILVCLLTIAILAVQVFAQEELPDPGITPDSRLYGLDRAIERLQLILTRDRVAKARLHLRLVEERLAEANTMFEKGKPEFAQSLMKDHEKEINETEVETEKARAEGRNVTDLVEHISSITYKHITILSDLLDRVPEQAKPHIEHAINVSSKGHIRALKRLGDVEPEKVAGLSSKFAEKRLLKAKEMIEKGKTEHGRRLIEEYEKEVNETQEAIEKAKRLGRNVTELAEHVANMTYKHIEALETLLEKVPEPTKIHIEHAINISIKGHETAVERILERINKTEEKVRRVNCTTDADCKHLICPQVLGHDTPVCHEGNCKCGGKWEIVNKTEWRERFKEEWTNETQRRVERIKQSYGKTKIEEKVKQVIPIAKVR